VTTLF